MKSNPPQISIYYSLGPKAITEHSMQFELGNLQKFEQIDETWGWTEKVFLTQKRKRYAIYHFNSLFRVCHICHFDHSDKKEKGSLEDSLDWVLSAA